MGPLTPPPGGPVYVDANAFIYTVERVDPYKDLLDPFWQDVRATGTAVLSSELTALETLVKPLRLGDAALEAAFRAVLDSSPDVRLVPVSRAILERAILERATLLRATPGLKTPDAIHAATALIEGCALFVTNDPAFGRVPGLHVVVLRDLLPP